MRRRFWLGLLLAVLALGSLCAGRYGSSLSDIARALLFSGDELTQSLVWNLRMPRILLVSISGAALAVSGVVYQTIFRNPLASGDVIGASSGCSLGAVFAILFYQESWFIELCAFLTGMLLVILTFLLASRVRGNRILNLVVAGLILQAVATSLMMMMKLYADPATQLANMEYWLMGGFSDASWSAVFLTLVLCTLGMSGLYLLRWQIQLLSFGEEAPWRQCEAHTMGIPASGYPSDFQCDQCCGNRQLGFSADTPYYPYRLSQADFTDDGNYSSQRSDLSASVRYTGTDPYDD